MQGGKDVLIPEVIPGIRVNGGMLRILGAVGSQPGSTWDKLICCRNFGEGVNTVYLFSAQRCVEGSSLDKGEVTALIKFLQILVQDMD